MTSSPAKPSDVPHALDCLTQAFADDPITGFLLGPGPGYQERLARFFSLLMRARIALDMPVIVTRGDAGIDGVAMGYTTARPAWPTDVAQEWELFERQTPDLANRMAIYDTIAETYKPAAPHYYLGVIGTQPSRHGSGLGTRLLHSFCDLSSADRLSSGVYLETANPSNVGFYERAGFAVVGRGDMHGATLWCMFLEHRRNDGTGVRSAAA